MTNSNAVTVGEEFATSGTLDGVTGIDGLGLGAACVSPASNPSLVCASDADWTNPNTGGTEASCPVGCEFYPACLGGYRSEDGNSHPGGWDGDFRSEGWSGGDGLGVTTAECLVNGGTFTFSGCADVDECTSDNDNGDCGDDATCANTPGGR